MAQFAAGTSVSSERTRGEIERTLRRYGADAFAYGWEDTRAVLQFRAHGRYVKFELPMPDRAECRLTPTGRQRGVAEIDSAFERAVRQRWRALALVVKAKLEAVSSGITSFEDEFLAHTLLPDGQTVGEWVAPQVADAYESGAMPKLLPAGRP